MNKRKTRTTAFRKRIAFRNLQRNIELRRARKADEAQHAAMMKAINSGSTVRREAPKVGRNDPCTCGSGNKFKRCCLNKPVVE